MTEQKITPLRALIPMFRYGRAWFVGGAIILALAHLNDVVMALGGVALGIGVSQLRAGLRGRRGAQRA